MGALYQVDGMPGEFYKHNADFPRLCCLKCLKIFWINLWKKSLIIFLRNLWKYLDEITSWSTRHNRNKTACQTNVKQIVDGQESCLKCGIRHQIWISFRWDADNNVSENLFPIDIKILTLKPIIYVLKRIVRFFLPLTRWRQVNDLTRLYTVILPDHTWCVML